LLARNNRIEIAISANLWCVSGTLFESILRADGPQNGFHTASVVGGPMGQLLFGLVRSTPETRDNAAIEAARRRAITAWTIVDDAVADRPYLAGAGLSLAEIVLGTQIYRWFTFPVERPAMPKLRAWYDRMRERPGFKTHIEVPIT
jgi:glutathione S-transferase